MKRLLLVAIAALCLPGCGFFTSPDIQCWYGSTAEVRRFEDPWFVLRGRVGKYRDDVYGPMFKTPEAMNQYIAEHKLALCGTAK